MVVYEYGFRVKVRTTGRKLAKIINRYKKQANENVMIYKRKVKH